VIGARIVFGLTKEQARRHARRRLSARPPSLRVVALAAALIGVFGVVVAAAAAAHHKHHRHHRHHRHHKHHRAAHTGRCAGANTHANLAPLKVMRHAVLCLINKERAAFGLPPLSASSRLNDSAQGWTNTMVQHGIFSHGDPGGRISAAGYNWSAEGENIATGYRTPNQVVSGWMHSAGHCSNILSPNYSDVGTGVSGHPVSGYASGPATWTQDFGRWMGHGSPSGNSGPANSCPH
jgi:uncharacterized protein YkwD